MGRPALISRGAVLAAALAVADQEGLEGVTMLAVARLLGVTPMALYRHVGGKDDLLDGLVEVLVDDLAAAAPGSGAPGLRGGVEAFAAAAASLAKRHPAVCTLLLTRPVNTPSARARREEVHGLLRGFGVAGEQVVMAERLLTSTVLALAAGQAAGRFSVPLTDADLRAAVDFIVAGIGAFLPDRARTGAAQ
ncbi:MULTISPECIES: TetR/AcrR family transcriptional regulator [Bifidobacterium]|jgi:AcrR family transcriptional regulator|uniref:TetR/AcrR family transcriptional regulator n=1 Tax=Bifidobacterium tibiigranuli TaxID=2172043 RepID=A0A5N6S4L9_9BIFI|nr:TetR/AcrR family transcriptional regulator [Bifidobacterium tibiigranuli]KAE8129267.1 TetR/AcrR family transcriptional regulator [Bifidobacterium tibiigranuli]KAE8129505.1 TetR/AcrR family transcriptional regulator [Bifidobacterium tibiigranuli]